MKLLNGNNVQENVFNKDPEGKEVSVHTMEVSI